MTCDLGVTCRIVTLAAVEGLDVKSWFESVHDM